MEEEFETKMSISPVERDKLDVLTFKVGALPEGLIT